MSDQEPTSDLDRSIADLGCGEDPHLSIPYLWESKSWTYTESIPRLLVPFHFLEDPGEYLVTVTLVAKADSFVPFSYTVNDQIEEVTQPIFAQSTYLNLDNAVNSCHVELDEVDARKQLTFASVTLTRCTNKKYQDALIPRLSVRFSKKYFEAEGLGEDEQKRRYKVVRDFYHSDENPIVQYGIDGISWSCRGEEAAQHYGNVPTSALEEFSEWVMHNHIYREYVRLEFSYCLWNFYQTRYVDEK